MMKTVLGVLVMEVVVQRYDAVNSLFFLFLEL